MSDPTNQDDTSTNETNSTEATATETSPSDAPVEKKSARDEKGLTLGGRTMLRIYLEFGRISTAAARLGERIPLEEILVQRTMMVEVLDLLMLASGMGQKLGSVEDVRRYLEQHRDEDDKSMSELRKGLHEKHGAKLAPLLGQVVDQMLARGDPCEVCGQKKCVSCHECHACAERKGSPLN